MGSTTTSKHNLPYRLTAFFFLERAGELRIIILRRKGRGYPPQKSNSRKGAVTPLITTSILICLNKNKLDRDWTKTTLSNCLEAPRRGERIFL